MRTRRPFIAVLCIRTVPGEVTSISALITPAVRVKPSAPSTSRPRPGVRHPDPAPADLHSIGTSRRIGRIVRIAVNDECKAGHGPRHPDLLQRPVTSENAFEVAFSGALVEVGHVQPRSVLFFVRATARTASSVAMTPIA